MAVTTQELITISDKLVKNTQIHKLDNISTLGYQELRNLFGSDLPEKMRLNGIEQDRFNQQASLLKIKIFVLYNLLKKTKESKYYSQMDNLIRQLNQQPSVAIREERIKFQQLLADARVIINKIPSSPIPQRMDQHQVPQRRKDADKQEQYDYDSLEQINAKIQQLQKEQDSQKLILQQKYNNLMLRRAGFPQYPLYNQRLLAFYNKEVAEYENLRKKFEERNKLIAYYKKKSAYKAAQSEIQYTQLVTPAKQIAAQQRQALQNPPIAEMKLAEQAKQAIENARIAQMRIIAEQQAQQARERQIAAQQQTLEKARIEQRRLSEQLAQQAQKQQQIGIAGGGIAFRTPSTNQTPNIAPPQKYFTPEQAKAIKEYFINNPHASKIKRSLDRKGNPRKNKSVGIGSKYPIANLPYSVIKTEQGQVFVVTGEILGKGGMSVVKVAEHLDQNLQPTGNIVAAKIQGSTKYNEAYRDPRSGGYSLVPKIKGTQDEESILAILGEFLGHASNSFLCKLGLTKNKYNKQYTFLKLKKGQTIYKCFQDNKNSLKTNPAGQLKIFLATLQATKKLHDHQIIHGDLNFNNFMINDEGQVDVIDYGMAGKANARGLIKNDNASLWVAPEARPQGMHNFKSDIYTLGWWMQGMLERVATSSPLNKNSEFQKLLKDMTNRDYLYRPTIDECMSRMSSILVQEERLQQTGRGRFSGMGRGG